MQGPRRALSFLPWLALFAGALGARCTRYGLVLTANGVRFPHGADEMYHLRRIWYAVASFPRALDFDPYLNHPEGAASVWPPLFDWSIAAVARLLAGVDQAAVERVASFAPPVLGALAVLAAAALARHAFSPAAGWVVGAWLAVLPAHVFYGSLGEVDHHVAVGLFATGLVAAAMRVAGPLATSTRARGGVPLGLAVAACLLLWPGFLLHVLVIEAALVVQVLAQPGLVSARARALSLALAHAVAAAVLAPFCVGKTWPQFGAFSPIVLSNFQPLWLGTGAVALALAAALWRAPALGATRGRRLATSLALAALGFAAAWLLVPGLPASLAGGAAWFEEDPFFAVIGELQALLLREGRFYPDLAHLSFSYLFWMWPLGALWLAAGAWRARRGELGVLLAWSAAFGLATLYQQRFMDVFAAGFALVVGPALCASFGAAWRAAAPWPLAARRLALGAAALLVLVLAASPYASGYLVDLRASRAARTGRPLLMQPEARQRLVMAEVGHWLRENTPPTRGYLDASEHPEYGVLAPWGHGHMLRYVAERPMVQDNFGPWGGAGFERAGAYYASRDEAEAVAIAEALRARYVVGAPQGSGQGWPEPGSLGARLALALDPRGRPVFGPGAALARHRLVFVASDAALHRAGVKPWAAGIYEIVAGARVAGSVPPDVREVRFTLDPLGLPGAEALRYEAAAPVDAVGRYEIVLPYPSAAGAPYRVRAGGEEAVLAVAEADVREGLAVPGPRFALKGPSFAARAGLSPRP